ncbi:MAG: 2-oxoacid:acceptor oxidoreductase family protein, partial [bacterium]
HKMANPKSIVISYQGDGDLGAIGLAEIMQAAQMGLPMTVIFINNAIYGMTGGQMAPTTLMNQVTSTSTTGRSRMAGEPMKIAEIMAQLDGPIYVERVALYDNKQRTRAKRAILKALRLQAENKGFAFVEVLSECPTHLKVDTAEAENWVKEKMTPIFPLGVKKDLEVEPWFEMKIPQFTPQNMIDVIGATKQSTPTFCKAFPSHVAEHDISLKLAGTGGDGAQTAALLLTRTAINEGFDSTHIPSYGPESRGGTSYADVHIATDEVLSPASPNPHILIAFNAPSLAKFGPTVVPCGTIIYDSTVISEPLELDSGVKMHGIPFTQIAADLGRLLVKNIVALGALQAATDLLPQESLLTAIRQALQDKCAMIPLNEEAFAKGVAAYAEYSKN